MPFSRNSRNSSRHQSVESITEAMDINEPNDTEDIKIYLNESELQNLMNKPKEKDELTKIMTNPMGKLLVQLGNLYNKVNDQNKMGAESIQISEICKAFQDTTQSTQNEITSALKASTRDLKESLYRNQLNFHMINPLIQTPKEFSPHDTLISVSKQVDAAKLFPQNKMRFSGEPHNGPDITEFIFNMNSGQSRMKLSEAEFKDRLLMCTTSHAHKLIRTLINEQDSIDAIFHKLMVLYDHTVTPEKAKAELLKFKIHKRSTLIKAQAKILELASAAARMFPQGPLRKAFSNAEACCALIRSLPPTSSTLVSSQYNVMISKQADDTKIPLFTELIMYLNPYRQQIDQDIAENGSNFDTSSQSYRQMNNMNGKYTNMGYRNRLQINSLGTNYSSQAPNTTRYNNRYEQTTNNSYKRPSESQGGRNNPGQKNPFQVYSLNRTQTNSRQNFNSNKYMNTLYCSLCSQTNHTASQGCYKMRDENGRTVPITPSQIPCHICEKKINKKLYHPVRYCFNKDNQTQGNRRM